MTIRWRRWVMAMVIGAVGLLALLWFLLPSLTVAVARRRLPMVIDRSLTITAAATDPQDLTAMEMARVMVAASPGRIRAVAAALGRPLPMGLLRDGLCVQAEWHEAKHAPELPIELVGVVRRAADPPFASAAFPVEPLAQLIKRTAQPVRFMGNTLRWTYRLDPGSVLAHEGPPIPTATGVRRRFRATASGQVTAWLNDTVCERQVTRLVGHVDIDADRRDDGWHLRGTVDVESVESHVVHSTAPLLENINLEAMLELLLNNDVLSEPALRKNVLPSWFPIDLGFQAVVAAEPSECAAAAGLPSP